MHRGLVAPARRLGGPDLRPRRSAYGQSPTLTAATSPAEVAEVADILTIHLALAPDTRGLVGGERAGSPAPGALLVNTARAEVVDHAALLAAAVRDRGLRGGLDVYPEEPTAGTGEFGLTLLEEPGVYGTHHIGASTEQAQEADRRGDGPDRAVVHGDRAGPNVVNPPDPGHHAGRRHEARRLAHVFEHLSVGG